MNVRSSEPLTPGVILLRGGGVPVVGTRVVTSVPSLTAHPGATGNSVPAASTLVLTTPVLAPVSSHSKPKGSNDNG